MKKIFISSIIALALILGSAANASAAFTTYLTVGSTGADVSALQTWLLANGFVIPSISAGTAAKGYFGQQTKAAVVKYQASVGLPATGFVGPLTIAKLNGTAGTITMTPVSCPAGYVCTPAVGSPVVPVNPVGPIVMDGTDGSLTVSQSSFVSTGATIKKGETKNVVAVKLQATAGPVSVTRIDAHFSVRPWLFFNQVQLVDSSGAVIARKTISSQADVTEITVGSDYLVRFDGINYTVRPGVNPDIAVGVSVLSATDKITNGMTVYAAIPSDAIRTVNGKGYTDSIGGVAQTGGVLSASGAGASSFTLSSTGSVADIATRISPLSPATQVTVPVSATLSTNNVTLGLFSIKSANNSSTVNGMAFNVTATVNGAAINETTVLSNVRIMVGSQTYGALTFTSGGVATFTNLNLPLSQDMWTDVKLVADVVATTSDVVVSSVLDASTIDAIDSTYTQATVGGVAMASATNDQTSINTLLTINSVSLTLGSTPVVVTQELKEKANSSVTTAAAVDYTFTLTNNSSNTLYVSGAVATFINATSSIPSGNASSTITAIKPVTAVPGDDTSATPTYYILPSGGASRTFTVQGLIQSRGGATASEGLKITSIQYGSTTAGTGSSITSGLTTLNQSVVVSPKN